MSSDDRKKKEIDGAATIRNVGVASANSEVVNRYGSANAEYIKGYKGNDAETGQVFNKGLKEISQYKVNQKYIKQNLNQQAGFSAEVVKTSRDNAENIIQNNNKRTIRADDCPGLKTNHEIYDHVEMTDGLIIEGSGSQMKFVNHPEKILDGIAKGEGGGKKDLSRYLDSKLDLPSDQFEQAKRYCDDQAQSLRKQAQHLKGEGKQELAAKMEQQAERYEKIKDNIRDSGISKEEAMLYREHPELATAGDIFKTSHRAGCEGAMIGAAIGGTIAIVQNAVALIKDDKDLEEAIWDASISTGKATIVGYGTAAVGSALKGVMQQMSDDAVLDMAMTVRQVLTSKSQSIGAQEFTKLAHTSKEIAAKARCLSKTALPALAVSVCLEVGGTIARYAKGEIDGVQFLEELGEKGSGMLASGLGATLAQIAIPIPIVGGLIGGMIGYSISSMFYQSSLAAFKEAKQAREDYLRVKAQCEIARELMQAYRLQLEALFAEHLVAVQKDLGNLLDQMDAATKNENMAVFANAANGLGKLLGKSFCFETMDDFEQFMISDKTLIL